MFPHECPYPFLRAEAAKAKKASSAESDAAEAETCVVCLEGSRTHAFLPCGHRSVCQRCADRVIAAKKDFCPMCREPFQSVVRIFT